MAAPSTVAPVVTLALSEPERELLRSVLEQALREKRVEIHRTDSLDYRKYLEEQETLLNQLLDRLHRP
jgi:hypothetical protein